MATKTIGPKRTKKFDCLKMMDEIQAKIMAEWEARKAEFPSFVDFINATAKESPFVQEIERKLRKANKGK
jgi:hypothetical protein